MAFNRQKSVELGLFWQSFVKLSHLGTFLTFKLFYSDTIEFVSSLRCSLFKVIDQTLTENPRKNTYYHKDNISSSIPTQKSFIGVIKILPYQMNVFFFQEIYQSSTQEELEISSLYTMNRHLYRLSEATPTS